jgi:hypothetical protein
MKQPHAAANLPTYAMKKKENCEDPSPALHPHDHPMLHRARVELATRVVLSTGARKWLADALDAEGKSHVVLRVQNRQRGNSKYKDLIDFKELDYSDAAEYARALVRSGALYKQAIAIASERYRIGAKLVEREYGKIKKTGMPVRPLSYFTGEIVDDEERRSYDQEWDKFVEELHESRSSDEIREEAEAREMSRIDDFTKRAVVAFMDRVSAQTVASVAAPIAAYLIDGPSGYKTKEFVSEIAELLIQRVLEGMEKSLSPKIEEYLVSKVLEVGSLQK